mgnify:FL=1
MGNQTPVLHCRTPERLNGCDIADCVLEMRSAGEQEKVDMDFELLQSVKKGELEVVKDLISRNADVNIRQPSLVTLERYRSGKVPSRGFTPLMCAASNGDSKVIIALIAARANVNDINERGETPLHLAASSGDINSFEELVKAEANYNILTNEGDNVLEYLPTSIIEDKVVLKEFEAVLPNLNKESEDLSVPSEASRKNKGKKRFRR